jgi:SAM-dependent methyltransferase
MLKRIVASNRKVAAWLEYRFPSVFGASCYKAELKNRILSDITALSPQTILEVGGIDRPLLERHSSFQYVGLDVEERPDCNNVYDRFIVQSIEQPVDISADLLISITLMEHVPDNFSAVKSMFEALRPGGKTHHYIPSKWHPYSLALRAVGPTLQKRLIPILRPAAVGVTGYPAFFDHCSPAAMRNLFEEQGFVSIDVMAFYRASDYFAFLLPAYLVVTLFENLCFVLGWSFFASGFVISARKPES